MAQSNDIILRICSGKMGGYIVYQRLGQTCIRSKPQVKTSTTTRQIAQQERITAVAIFYKAVCSAGFLTCWQKAEKPQGWTGYNLFVHNNVKAFTADGTIGDFTKLQLTTGPLQLPDEIQLRQKEDGEYVLEWKNTTLYPSSNENDRICIAAMRDKDRFDIKIPHIGDFRRKDCKATFRLSEEYKAYTHFFCYMSIEEGGVFSINKFINL